MKSSEAKTKWCPFARSVGDNSVANRRYDGTPDSGALCIASDCMAWRVRLIGKTRDADEGECGLVKT